jgi:hypothetical protein
MTPEGIDYIKRMLAQGYSKDIIKQTLINNSWPASEVDAGFLAIDQPADNNSIKPSLEPVTGENKQPGSKSKIIVILAFVLVLIALLVFLGYFYLNRNLVLGRMLSNLTTLNSLAFDGSFESKITDFGTNNLLTQSINNLDGVLNKTKIAGVNSAQSEAGETDNSGSFDVNFSGGFDYSNKSKPLIKSEFFINYDLPEIGTGKGATIDYRQIEKTLYMKLDLLNNKPNLGLFDLTPLNNQWVRINLPENTKVNVQQEVDPVKLKKLKNILAKNNPLIQTKKIPIIKHNNGLAYDYQFNIDKQKLKDLARVLSQDFPDALTTSEADQFIQELDQFETMPSGEIIIGLFDSTIYKFKLSWQVANKNNLNIDGSGTLEINFRNHNLAYPVEVPVGSKSWEELSVEIQKNMNEKATSDSDNDGLSDQMEIFYKTDPNNPDTDADGYKDGEEVINGYSPSGPGKLENQADLNISTN